MNFEKRKHAWSNFLNYLDKTESFNNGFDDAYHYDTTPMDTGNKNSNEDFKFDISVQSLLKYLEGIKEKKIIVDFGCGVGWLVKYLTKKNTDDYVAGVDFSRTCIDSLRQEGFNAVRCNIEKLPEELNNTVDVAFSRGVIHHSETPVKAFERIIDSITDKGVLFIALYSGVWWHKIIQYYVHPIFFFLSKTFIGSFLIRYLMMPLLFIVYNILSLIRSNSTVSFDETYNQFSDLFLNTCVHFCNWDEIFFDYKDKKNFEFKKIGSDIYGAMNLYFIQKT